MAKQHLVRSLLPEVGRSELRHPPSAPLPSARKSLPSTAVGEAHHELADGETESVGAALGTRRLLSARSLINRVKLRSVRATACFHTQKCPRGPRKQRGP